MHPPRIYNTPINKGIGGTECPLGVYIGKNQYDTTNLKKMFSSLSLNDN
jgi:hypothetical protein